LSTDKLKRLIITICYRASNKAAGGETTRHQYIRAISGGNPALNIIRIENTKDFWENIP
jgi:hypothetical protein